MQGVPQHPKGHHLEGMSSMMTSEKRPRRRSIHRRSEKRIRSAKKAARPELCKNDWEDWTKARSDFSSFDSQWVVYSLKKILSWKIPRKLNRYKGRLF